MVHGLKMEQVAAGLLLWKRRMVEMPLVLLRVQEAQEAQEVQLTLMVEMEVLVFQETLKERGLEAAVLLAPAVLEKMVGMVILGLTEVVVVVVALTADLRLMVKRLQVAIK
jgi:hypothetical protein